MGLTNAVVLGLLLMLPGIAFVLGLSRLYSERKPTSVLDDHFSAGVIGAAFAALALHWIAVVLLGLTLPRLDLPSVNVGQVFALLAGDTKSALAGAALGSVEKYPVRIGLYFLVLTLLAAWLGRSTNRFFRVERSASWYELLHPGKDSGVAFIWLTADMELGGKCYLFAGEVLEFSVAKEGHLERVVLRGAMKRSLVIEKPSAKSNLPCPDPWMDIPGEFVVLQLTQTTTVNVDYWAAEAISNADALVANSERAEPA